MVEAEGTCLFSLTARGEAATNTNVDTDNFFYTEKCLLYLTTWIDPLVDAVTKQLATGSLAGTTSSIQLVSHWARYLKLGTTMGLPLITST